MALAGVGAETLTLTSGGDHYWHGRCKTRFLGGARTGQGGGAIDARDYFRDLGIICV